MRIRTWFNRLGIPFAPVWIAGVFVLRATVFNLIFHLFPDLPVDVRRGLHELKESNGAFLFTLIAYAHWTTEHRVAVR